MTIRIVHLDRPLPQLHPSQCAAWITWLSDHGLPTPRVIPSNSCLVIDDQANTIAVEVYQFDEHGNRGERQTRSIHLEQPAAPIPAGYQITEA